MCMFLTYFPIFIQFVLKMCVKRIKYNTKYNEQYKERNGLKFTKINYWLNVG